jgi:hypothetical protein
MGKKNKERRAAKKRRRHGTAGPSSAPRDPRFVSGGSRQRPPTPQELLGAAVWSWGGEASRYEAALAALVRQREEALVAVDGLLREAAAGLWEHGWTPADVVHVTSRRLSAAHGDIAAGVVVADGRARAQRGEALHPRWEAQLGVLDGRVARPSRLDSQLRTAVEVLCVLTRLPTVPTTVPRPGHTSDRSLGAAVRLDERVLARVRALLAKAESTEFDEEAEALTAKAQELIARHAIDEALVHSADNVGEPSVRRIPVDDPYADAKATLLAQVAGANRARGVYTADCGWVTVFGYDQDLDAIELLAASLLVQATSAMARHGSRRDAYGRSTTRSFRRSFLLGFAYRIGHRLREAAEAQVATVSASDHGRLLPVLAARDDRLMAAEQAAFPHLVRRSSSMSNSAGWAAGHVAADLADLRMSAGALRGDESHTSAQSEIPR